MKTAAWSPILGFFVACAGSGLAVTSVDPRLPAYEPRPVDFPRGASYVNSAGAIAIVGYNDMSDILAAVDARFLAAHPGFKFALDLRGTRTAPAALWTGRSALAPMGAEFLAADAAAYRQAVGNDPVPVAVGHDAIGPEAKSGPIAIIVHPSNPIARLTVGQVTDLFTQPARGRPLAQWGDLGRAQGGAIHPVGIVPTAALSLFMVEHHFGHRPYVPGYRGFAESVEVVRHVAADPDAIGFCGMNPVDASVKVLAIARTAEGPFFQIAPENLVAGRYPFDRVLYLFVRRPPGSALDLFVAEYLRLMLSREGQAAVAASPQHYLPLSADEAAAERAKLGL